MTFTSRVLEGLPVSGGLFNPRKGSWLGQPVASRTMKLSACSSNIQGGGKRRAKIISPRFPPQASMTSLRTNLATAW